MLGQMFVASKKIRGDIVGLLKFVHVLIFSRFSRHDFFDFGFFQTFSIFDSRFFSGFGDVFCILFEDYSILKHSIPRRGHKHNTDTLTSTPHTHKTPEHPPTTHRHTVITQGTVLHRDQHGTDNKAKTRRVTPFTQTPNTHTHTTPPPQTQQTHSQTQTDRQTERDKYKYKTRQTEDKNKAETRRTDKGDTTNLKRETHANHK